jgi:hypothetical protein
MFFSDSEQSNFLYLRSTLDLIVIPNALYQTFVTGPTRGCHVSIVYSSMSLSCVHFSVADATSGLCQLPCLTLMTCHMSLLHPLIYSISNRSQPYIAILLSELLRLLDSDGLALIENGIMPHVLSLSLDKGSSESSWSSVGSSFTYLDRSLNKLELLVHVDTTMSHSQIHPPGSSWNHLNH